MQKLLPGTVLVLGAGFTVLTLSNPTVLSQLTGPNQGSLASAPTSPQQQNARPTGEATQITQVDFQDNQPLTMSSDGSSKYHATLFVRNDESTESTLQFSVLLENSQGQLLSEASRLTSAPSNVAANSVARIRIDLDASTYSTPLSGYLELTAKTSPDRKASTKYRVVKVPPVTPSPWATRLFWISLLGTALVALGATSKLRKEHIPINQRMGSPTWNFGDSWGTNIAVGGALLNTLVTFSALPDQTRYLSKISYVCVSMIFGAVITVAPSLYSLIRTAVAVPVPGGNPAIQYQGYVGSFALASALTAWGAIGQVVTVAFLFAELGSARLISISILACLATVLALTAIFLLVYEGRTIVQIARLQKAASDAADAAVKGGGSPAGLPSWSVL